MLDGKISYSLSEELCVVKMVGRVQYFASLDLGVFVKSMADTPFQECVIDLTEATYLDSTSLGVIAGLKSLEQEKPNYIGTTIYSTDSSINDILYGVGLQTIFEIKNENPKHGTELLPIVSTNELEDEDTRDIFLGAHKELSTINEENRSTFSNVIELLEGESKGNLATV